MNEYWQESTKLAVIQRIPLFGVTVIRRFTVRTVYMLDRELFSFEDDTITVDIEADGKF